MKPTREAVAKVVLALSEVVPFFPKTEFGLELVTEFVLEFVGNDEQLQWFARAAGRSLSRYEGMPQLRALFCTKYAAADGIQPLVEVEGMSEDQLEADFKRREMAANEARLEEYRRQAALAPPEDRAPLELPAACDNWWAEPQDLVWLHCRRRAEEMGKPIQTEHFPGPACPCSTCRSYNWDLTPAPIGGDE